MRFDALSRRSLSLFEAVGGWRTVAEAVASRAAFVLVHLLTGQVLVSALATVGAVAVVATVRALTDRNHWPAIIGLTTVTVSALLAGSTGNAVDFYLTGMLTNLVAGPVFLASMLLRWPLVGVIAGGVRGERFAWRRDRNRLRRYQLCTAIFLAKFAIAAAVMLPLYLDERVTALGIAATFLGSPAAGVCVYSSWRILRAETGQAASSRAARSRSSCGTANRSP